MNREELIEKLRGLRRSAVHALSADDVMTIDHAISVFEQAHTPTDDERKALEDVIWGALEPLPDYFAPKPMPQGWVQAAETK